MNPASCFLFCFASLAFLISPCAGMEMTALQFPGNKNPLFQYQVQPLKKPKGGKAFAASAFIHPFSTPRGFVCTEIQPSDHLHHLGFWWPWKYVGVGGKKYVTWELQKGEGQHRAKSVKVLSQTEKHAEYEFINETLVKPKGAEPMAVILETARVVVKRRENATVMDIWIDQKPIREPVTISKNHYSGFSWRGPASWNKDNSTLLSSEGKGRDDANGTPARWLVASGSTDTGTASVLIMSNAEHISGSPERLRVWGSEQHNGAPFVNFNPVTKEAIPLDGKHPAVSKRSYRVIAADHAIRAEDAEAEWKTWTDR